MLAAPAATRLGAASASRDTPAAVCQVFEGRRSGASSGACRAAGSLPQHPGSRPCFGGFHSGRAAHHMTIQPLRATAGADDTTLAVVSTEEEFNAAINSHELVVVDFMARWCRKCIYLKPKLERMIRTEFPGLHILFVDVNAVPSAVIKNAGIKKMPTVQLYRNGEKGPEHIAAEGAIDALEKIKLMILRNTDLKLPEKTA